ncbi:leukotriene A-4 hydrolase [Aphis craccivora]|uniref:Leukotriene A-4 hydrolase n=1 Tax=Aphis craccivora TaxID=307492 RepID=A0A6G0Y2C4_APHCR|nr:leukotriene A-4 hydrolase [Aphis craccivora]
MVKKVVVTHIDKELATDFENDTLQVFVDLSITKIDESCDYIILDNIYLNVISIKNKNGGILLDYSIGDRLDSGRPYMMFKGRAKMGNSPEHYYK